MAASNCLNICRLSLCSDSYKQCDLPSQNMPACFWSPVPFKYIQHLACSPSLLHSPSGEGQGQRFHRPLPSSGGWTVISSHEIRLGQPWGLQTEMPHAVHREQILLLKTHTPVPVLSEEEQNKAGVIFPSQRLQWQLIHTRTGSRRTQTVTSDVTVAPQQILWQRQWSIKWSSGGPKIKCIDSFEPFRNTRKHHCS